MGYNLLVTAQKKKERIPLAVTVVQLPGIQLNEQEEIVYSVLAVFLISKYYSRAWK